MAVEVFHQGGGRTVLDCPEAGDDTLGAGSEERSREVHDAFLARQTSSSGFARRKHDDISIQPGTPDLACLPKTVFGIRAGGQHERGAVWLSIRTDAVGGDVNHLEISQWLRLERGFRCFVAIEGHTAGSHRICCFDDLLSPELYRLKIRTAKIENAARVRRRLGGRGPGLRVGHTQEWPAGYRRLGFRFQGGVNRR